MRAGFLQALKPAWLVQVCMMIPAQERCKSMEYIAYLHKERKSDYGVSFPDFPGCVTAGKTLDQARRMAVEALSLHIEGMMEDGEALPDASTLDALANDPDMKGAVAFLVNVDVANHHFR
ncbi:MAG TPA: type II toxin-antitoxin system HicB family antitoxin [Candidatus Saccharimonadales bacterium]|jgi:predicted RNase H-like HicB family nuclease|nr:type II toxin-antitoxin system HicB family antitoxin [Candidatus Saccharimonadales bacterium]